MHKSKVLVLAVTVCLSCVSLAFSQDGVITVTNADVLTMVRAKLPAAVIIEKINNSSCSFDTFPSVLAELKYKGVPDEVLMAMTQAPHGIRPAAAAEVKPAYRADPKPANNIDSVIPSDKSFTPQREAPAAQQLLTNKDIIKMIGVGLSASIIEAKIKGSPSSFDTSPEALSQLKKTGAADTTILAMIELANSSSETKSKPSGRITDELTKSFTQLQSSVVTVWSELGHGTGFIFDRRGLVMTNQHVIGPSEYVAVQFDSKLKVPARILSSNAEKDVAILWINLDALPGASVAPLAKINTNEPTVIEGERVLTIGSPLNQRKVMTTGIVSKVEPRAIISDININHGNSGGPLFNSLGEVVGITTFGDVGRSGFPGISGIVRIEQTLGMIEQAQSQMKGLSGPKPYLLPVEPTNPFPLEALKSVVLAEKFDTDRYFFGVGEFQVTMMTPPLTYRLRTEAEREAAKTKNKRNDKDGAVQGTFDVLDEFKGWREYVGEYKPVLTLRATPKMGESFWGAFGRGFAAAYGIHARANIRFKTDFYRMKLMCGNQEVLPIHPAKIAHVMSESNYFVRRIDATYEGLYTYPANAISSACGEVRLEIFSERNPEKPSVKVLSEKTVNRIAEDFQPYFSRYGQTDLVVTSVDNESSTTPAAKKTRE